jgi:hypothetical protein
MRIWTFHPEYLDRQGLLALWREALLAQKVLRGLTRGYRAHPQLLRFRAHPDPVGSIGFYLAVVHEESAARGYRFDRSKIFSDRPVKSLTETDGQLFYEWGHFMKKLAIRDMQHYRSLEGLKEPKPHPLFMVVEGEIRSWERTR